MQQTAIFIDGPLAQECKTLPGFPPIWNVPLPKRETHCWCNEDRPDIFESQVEIFAYYRIMTGEGIALYSKHRTAEDILRSLREWVVTDLSNVDKLTYGCRDRRAFQ